MANQVTGAQLNQVTLSNNPTINYDQLVIQPSTLGYNLYKLIFQVRMTYNSIYVNEVYSYIQVVPSGLLVNSVNGAIGGGTYQMALGTGQALTLDPRSHSTDVDGIANIKTLNFTIYCQVIDNGVAYGYPQLYYNTNLDLLTIAKNYAQSSDIQNLFNSNNTQHSCFSSISNMVILQ